MATKSAYGVEKCVTAGSGSLPCMAPLCDRLVEFGDEVVGVALGKASVCPCAWRMISCIVVALSLKLLKL